MTEYGVADSRIRPMTTNDLELVLSWRNHPDIRRYMYSQHEIALAEHQRWFAGASQDPRKHLLIFECNGQPLGYVNFNTLSCGRVADWGFYIAPDAPKGSGRQLGCAALEYAFLVLNLHKVCGQALSFNDRSIKFHLALGFEQEGILREQYFDSEHFHSVICFGLLEHEWRSINKGQKI